MVYSVICVNYQMNTEFITQAFCVNKDKPEVLCNGKCYLAKQLEDERSKSENRIEFRSDFNIFIVSERMTFSMSIVDLPFLQTHIHPQSDAMSLYFFEIETPPEA